jgi:phage recombination protein Bet
MSTNVATQDTPRLSLIADMARRYSMEPGTFAATLRATVIPKNATNEEFAAFLMVAKQYGLNPVTREIFAFPKQDGGIQPIVSVDGWANLINSHPACDGFEFDDHLDGGGNIVSITCKIYRKDRARPTTTTEYMAECKRDTSTWKKWPRRMLRHKALIQAARYAFGFSGIVDPDEAERFTRPAKGQETAIPRDATPPAPPKMIARPPAAEAPPPPPAPAEIVSPETGEIRSPEEIAEQIIGEIGDAVNEQMLDHVVRAYDAEIGALPRALVGQIEDAYTGKRDALRMANNMAAG